MKTNLLLATVTAIALVGLPGLVMAQEESVPPDTSRDSPNFTEPTDDSGSSGSLDVEGDEPEDGNGEPSDSGPGLDGPTEPNGGEGEGSSGVE